ncbi:MAG: type III pantothenate kinase [Acidobacteriota bacterium]|nr:type III pantothenate kinase [Acidobacteriota bacterium]MDH3528797.1 type III pantothenate kinase [Acidobacteriota bacterium]
MLLTIDIGNSATKLAFFEGGKIVRRRRFSTIRDAVLSDFADEVADLLNEDIEGVAISSVVRELRDTYEELASESLAAPVMFVDHNSDLGFSINYDPPSDCGPDRLVAAHAAVLAAGIPVVVCDFGTATTIDLVTVNGYAGGTIAPGIETMANSLFHNTSRLPKVEIGKALKVVGNSTAGSIRSGIYFGYIGLVDGIISRMQSGLESLAPVVATGGYAELIAGESSYVDSHDPDLIHRGLHDIWQRNK